MKEKAKTVSRRDFLKVTGGAAAGIAVTGMAWRPGEAEAAAMPKKWNEAFDVVVVGSGFAGLAAAYEAKKAGASVVILEKMRTPGGNSIINGGVVSAAGSPMEARDGIKDSPELLLKDMLAAGLNLNHLELARLVAYESNNTVQWTINELGVKYKDSLSQEGGHSVPRMYSTYNQSGSAIVTQQLAKLKEIGVVPRTQVFLKRLLRDTDGRVKGVEVREKYVFPKENSGVTKFIKAKKAVVLATGGFGNDIAFRTIQDPRLTAGLESTNHPGATGEALRIGCTPVQLSWIQLGPWTSPDEKGFGLVPLFCERLVGYAPMVDPATGKRFIKETGDRKVRADAIILLGHPVLIFGDAYAVPKQVFPNALEKGLASGAIRKFDTLEALAQYYNIPQAALLEEVARWNGYVEKKKDPQFDCMIFPDAKPTVMPPFYAARLWPRVHHTMGGLVIDTNAQVTGFNMKPVPGLYAAGEVTGGVHGAVRLGSVAMADCVVFGRIAGRNAAAEKPWS